VEWIKLAQDSNRWQSLVNTMMNHRVLAPEVCYEMQKAVMDKTFGWEGSEGMHTRFWSRNV
jgi:hypothetical protein